MSCWSAIRGHQRQVELFRTAAQRGRLAHAYLFTGPEGIGKRLFALTLARCLLCEQHEDADLDACGQCPNCRMVAADSHPDLFVVQREPGKAGLSIEQLVGSRDNRGREGLCYQLSLRPMAGRRRIAVIDDADTMSPECANSLLKTLEEPYPNSVLILISENVNSLLPTIRSRCQEVRFAPLSPQDVTELLVEQNVAASREEAERLALLSGGSLAMAGRLQDPLFRELFELVYQSLSSEHYDPVAAAAEINDRLDRVLKSFKGSSDQQRRVAALVLGWCQEFYRQALWLFLSRSQDSFFATHTNTGTHESSEDDSSGLNNQASPCSLNHTNTSRTIPPEVERFVERFEPGNKRHLDWLLLLLERTYRAEELLERNVSVALCFESLLAGLAAILRAEGLLVAR